MADVTINELTRGTPTGGNILPYSTGSNTLGVPVSAILQNAGNIGIGTSNPLRLLHVEGITPGSQQVPFHVGGGESSIGFGVLECPVIFGWNGTLNSAHKPLSIRSTSAIQLYLNTDGKVGIGTTTPAAKLDVNGDVKATSYKTGSLPMFGANAFVHFNGGLDINGNASTANTERRIYAGGNVSSVLRNATGLYTIYFNTAMTTTEYFAVCSARHYDGRTWDVHCEVSNRQTTSCLVNIASNYGGDPGSTNYDSRDVDVMIIC